MSVLTIAPPLHACDGHVVLIKETASMPAAATRMDEFMGKILGDMGAAFCGALVLIGDKLGFYRAIAEHGPLTAAELAARTQTAERYVREWLSAQAASGYVLYDEGADRFSMNDEQISALADE